jgi:uncharacterized protein YjaZ
LSQNFGCFASLFWGDQINASIAFAIFKMMVKIKFYFPSQLRLRKAKNKREFVALIMESMHKEGTIKYAGYLKEKDLREDLLRHLGDKDINLYKSPSSKQKQAIEKDVRVAVKKCYSVLPHPNPPIFVFIYPWFPNADDNISLGGITALAAYYTMHLFVNLNSYARTSLEETIAHEWNHLVFYRHHPEGQPTLRAHMAMEGLAEVFGEEVMGGRPAPWAVALTGKEAQRQFTALRAKLNVKGMKTYREVFLGSKKYKRWTGYSIGYRLVSEFRKKHPKFSWEEMMKMKPENILETKIKKSDGRRRY